MATPIITTGNYPPHWSEGGVWDVLYLDGQVVPGLANVAVDIRNHYKIAQAQGIDLAPVTYKGREPKKLTVQIKLNTLGDLQNWNDFIRTIHLDVPGKTVTPHAIQHPQAQIYGVNQIVIEEVQVSQPNAKSEYLVHMRMIESGPTVPAKQAPGLTGKSIVFTTPDNGPSTTPGGRYA